MRKPKDDRIEAKRNVKTRDLHTDLVDTITMDEDMQEIKEEESAILALESEISEMTQDIAKDTYKTTTITWYYNPRSLGTLLIILIAAFTLPYFRYLNELFPQVHPGYISILVGLITMTWTMPFHILCDPKMGISSAILTGYIAAEFSVYGCQLKEQVVTPLVISFYYFMFLFGMLEATQTWPVYRGRGNSLVVEEPSLYSPYGTGGK